MFLRVARHTNELKNKLVRNNISITTAINPFWNENRKMFQDPDGYRIVVSPLKAIINEID